MRKPSRVLPAIVIGLLLGLLVFLAFYAFVFLTVTPTARPLT
jgi:amino acid transporter